MRLEKLKNNTRFSIYRAQSELCLARYARQTGFAHDTALVSAGLGSGKRSIGDGQIA